MSEKTPKSGRSGTDRRGFLKLASLGTVATGAALVSGKDAAAASGELDAGKSGYKETVHVRTFYDTARF